MWTIGSIDPMLFAGFKHMDFLFYFHTYLKWWSTMTFLSNADGSNTRHSKVGGSFSCTKLVVPRFRPIPLWVNGLRTALDGTMDSGVMLSIETLSRVRPVFFECANILVPGWNKPWNPQTHRHGTRIEPAHYSSYLKVGFGLVLEAVEVTFTRGILTKSENQ